MKEILVLLVGFCLNISVSAQASWELYEQNNFKGALLSYEEEINKGYHSYYHAAYCAALCGEKEKAWIYIEKAVELKTVDYQNILLNKDFSSLYNDKKWIKLLKEYGTEVEKITKTFEKLTSIVQLVELVPFKRNNLYGYMQYGTKKVIVEPIFTNASFYDSHLEVAINDFIVWIKPNGRFQKAVRSIKSTPKGGNVAEEFHSTPTALGFTVSNNVIIKYSSAYQELEQLRLNNKICARVKSNNKWSIIDEKGDLIVVDFGIKYVNINGLTEDGYREVDYFILETKEGILSLYKLDGTLILEKFDEILSIRGPYIVFKFDGKYGVLKKSGDEIIKPSYSGFEKPIKQLLIKFSNHYFFKFIQNKESFYVDEKGVEYR